jgi:hypothetical protein
VLTDGVRPGADPPPVVSGFPLVDHDVELLERLYSFRGVPLLARRVQVRPEKVVDDGLERIQHRRPWR